MTPKKIKTQTVEKSDYKIFLKKAKDFYNIMLTARDTENWTAVGLMRCIAPSPVATRCLPFIWIFVLSVMTTWMR